jgi:glutathione S-transferase
MRKAGLPFDEINVRLRLPESKAEILKHSPSGMVPTLIDGDLAIWDSLAIIEYLAERHPEAELWPRDANARAVARSASAEMHSGFALLRQHCSMEVLASGLLPSSSRPRSSLATTASLRETTAALRSTSIRLSWRAGCSPPPTIRCTPTGASSPRAAP